MARVVIYSADYCSYCRAAKAFFTQKGIEYEEIDVSADMEERQKLAERTGQMTVPQIFVGETHVGGYTDLRALDAKGGLQPLLQG